MTQVVYFTAVKFLEKLGSIAYDEISLAWGLKGDLKKLGETISTIKAVLLDAEEKQARNGELRSWLTRLKDAFLDAEDVLDEFDCEVLRRQVVKIHGGTTGEKVGRFFSRFNPIMFPISIGQKIKNMRERLDEIAADRAKFHLSEDHQNKPFLTYGRRAAVTHSFVRASEVIGRDVDKENMLHLLMDQDENNDNVSVIPICGIGGMGKTTLAKLVYNDKSVARHFELKMWVCVSDDFDFQRLVKDIIDSATGKINENFTLDQLQTRLRDNLKGKRFLLVLDDVWNENPNKWLELRELLMDGLKGSRIVVTTRKLSVASLMGTLPTYNLKGLSKEDCLSLFFKFTLQGQNELPKNLVDIGKQIVEKCEGVPLALRTLGSLLYSKLDERDWKYVRDNEIWKLEQTEDHILPALQLSYNELPSHLKRCFYYCSLFPKDWKISSFELILIWMAHGALESTDENRSLEEIGELYFKELWSRSFFQDVEELYCYYTFHMHDLIHDLALSVAQGECLIMDSPTKSIPERVRHLSFTYSCSDFPSYFDKLNNGRTIYFPVDGVGPLSHSFINKCISNFKYLRILDLSDSCFERLPSSIRDLRNLRYLDLSGNSRTLIPFVTYKVCKV